MGAIYFASADADLLRNADSSGAFGFFTRRRGFFTRRRALKIFVFSRFGLVCRVRLASRQGEESRGSL